MGVQHAQAVPCSGPEHAQSASKQQLPLAAQGALSCCRAAQTGQYNKIAFVRKLLDETDPAAAEWILFVEPEMVIDDPAFTFPFEFYAGRDLVGPRRLL